MNHGDSVNNQPAASGGLRLGGDRVSVRRRNAAARRILQANVTAASVRGGVY